MNQRKSHRRIVMIAAAFVVTLSWLRVPPVEAAPTSCEDLASLVLPKAMITAAQVVPAGVHAAGSWPAGRQSRTCTGSARRR